MLFRDLVLGASVQDSRPSMSPELVLRTLLPAVAFAVGACIGSFLNAAIHRLPRGLKLHEPSRSFCPSCGRTIPLLLNIPLVSWLMLRGRCRWCREPIAFRYFLVELVTALCFLAVWREHFAGPGQGGETARALGVVVTLWVLVALLLAATFIDIEHFIIPDSITLGGTAAGLLASFLLPELHDRGTMWGGLLEGAAGAALGFVLLWLVVLMGKMLFGKISHRFDEPQPFEISQPGGEEAPIVIRLGEHEYEWHEIFYRSWDRLDMEVTELSIDGEARELEGEGSRFRVVPDGFLLDGEKIDLESVREIRGMLTLAVVPREAMGFGDVKFIALIGAFLGWQAVLFTLFAASVSGAVLGLLQKTLLREQWTRPLPFGPYLAWGAFLWLFTGPAIWLWYLGLLRQG